MKKYETAIIVVAVLLIGYLFFKKPATTPANPVNSASPGYASSGAGSFRTGTAIPACMTSGEVT